MFASFENFSNADLGGNSQSGRNTNRAAVNRNDSAVVPCAVAVPEKVIAWLYLEIRAVPIESPTLGEGRTGARGGPQNGGD
jgi:hypothetical protein